DPDAGRVGVREIDPVRGAVDLEAALGAPGIARPRQGDLGRVCGDGRQVAGRRRQRHGGGAGRVRGTGTAVGVVRSNVEVVFGGLRQSSHVPGGDGGAGGGGERE